MFDVLDLKLLLAKEPEQQLKLLDDVNRHLLTLSPQERVEWAISTISGNHALTSSFGVQAAVCLHMYTSVKPCIPVIFIDTGYLFPETYQFIDSLKNKLNLNLKVFRSEMSPAWQESSYGKLWEQGIEGIKKYNRINKVLPMVKALNDLDLSIWHSGLRREQSESRKNLEFLSIQGGRFKFLPILDWSEQDIKYYLDKHELDYHPLFYKGYVSLGDTHTTIPLSGKMKAEDTRFRGLKRECGLHDESISDENNIDMSKYFKKTRADFND
ncbi:phosphoadenylyl-sulfate reductase [Vibrio splendidus]|uniref:phosphoadenylyl-sulfate reductase n=1 Tax=Vibrio splendidus TaxID=29497 RepID=UPI001C06A951|nr:phosphoadenylyl-sulfate reductase [Vibrio splendidus]MBU2910340.1 phosphoadenylyl-sulfate reductase [Vibrio splendidus]MDO6531112.1 phosphoadenylyl-sulfate reductase [Vibrio splendidus]MDO6552046.1 phosphoadenylyl-sulfate reductase [Vibrio splendidus]